MDAYVNSQTIAGKAGEWLERIQPFNQHEMAFNSEKSALLVIDMQEFFLDPEFPSFTCGGLAILPVLQRLIVDLPRFCGHD